MGIFDIFAAGVAHAAGRAASDAVRERQKAEEKAAQRAFYILNKKQNIIESQKVIT